MRQQLQVSGRHDPQRTDRRRGTGGAKIRQEGHPFIEPPVNRGGVEEIDVVRALDDERIAPRDHVQEDVERLGMSGVRPGDGHGPVHVEGLGRGVHVEDDRREWWPAMLATSTGAPQDRPVREVLVVEGIEKGGLGGGQMIRERAHHRNRTSKGQSIDTMGNQVMAWETRLAGDRHGEPDLVTPRQPSNEALERAEEEREQRALLGNGEATQVIDDVWLHSQRTLISLIGPLHGAWSVSWQVGHREVVSDVLDPEALVVRAILARLIALEPLDIVAELHGRRQPRRKTPTLRRVDLGQPIQQRPARPSVADGVMHGEEQVVLATRHADQLDPDEGAVDQVEGAFHVECSLLRQRGCSCVPPRGRTGP